MGIKWVCFRVGIYRRRVAGNAGGIFGRTLAGGCSLWASRFVASFENVVVYSKLRFIGQRDGKRADAVAKSIQRDVLAEVKIVWSGGFERVHPNGLLVPFGSHQRVSA